MDQAYLLEPADISWQDDAPYSATYSDIYWHRDGALEEKQFVFVKPLQQLIGTPQPASQVTVVELGFGFGVNCLLTAEFWQQMPANVQLNLVSIEKHPVSPADLARQLRQYGFTFTDPLLAQYPPPVKGQHVIWLANNIRLILVFDEADTALANLDAEVDFWYLDGFSPARNDAMWGEALYRKMFARSRAGARIATYSAAGHVRRGLEQHGFQVERHKGFSQKKEMLAAFKPGNWTIKPHGRDTCMIIGAGLAGLFSAEALQRRGLTYRLIDSGEAGPSTIPQLTVLPQLAVSAEARYQFSLCAQQYMQSAPGFNHSGLIWYGRTPEEQQRLVQIASHFPDNMIEQLAGGEVLFHQSGWLSFTELKAAIEPEITAGRITSIRTSAGKWLATDTQHNYDADHLILATGFNRLLLHDDLQIRAIRGQAISTPTRGITRVLNGQVTVFPTDQGRSVVSGTYAREDNLYLDDAETEHLIQQASKMTRVDPADIDRMVGIRAVSRDRLPVVGTAPVWAELRDINRVSGIDRFQAGLHYCTAFGSRGATHARLCAEQTVSKLLGEPSALDWRHQHMLSPGRFTIRDNKT